MTVLLVVWVMDVLSPDVSMPFFGYAVMVLGVLWMWATVFVVSEARKNARN